MRFRVIAILALFTAALILLSAAQATDYSGMAKVVLKLTKMPDMPAMPQNSATGAAETFGYSTALDTPAVPQGTTVQGEVLYSIDPAVKTGQAYTLYINYDPKNEPAGFRTGLIDKLKSGAVVGVNDYKLDGNLLTVNVGTSADWSKKISILDMQYTDPDEQKNPFMIDLSGFRQFDDFPVFNAPTALPLMNTSLQDNSFSVGMMQFPDIFAMIGGLFD